MPAAMILLLVAGGITATLLAARILARFVELPCPFWLSIVLENPLMNRLAGARLLIERADIHAGMRVLDIGCGTGRLTIPLAEQVGDNGEVVAVDVQEKMLQRVALRIKKSGVKNVSLRRISLGTGTLGTETFDRAVMVTVLGEIPDRETALREIAKVLNPGGILSITEVFPDPHYQTRRTIKRLAARTGFSAKWVHAGIVSHTVNLRPASDA